MQTYSRYHVWTFMKVYVISTYSHSPVHIVNPWTVWPLPYLKCIPLKHSQEGLSAEMERASLVWRSCVYFPYFRLSYFFFEGYSWHSNVHMSDYLGKKKKKMWDIRKIYVNTKFSFLCQVFLCLDWLQLYYTVVIFFQRYTSTFSATLIIYPVYIFLTCSRNLLLVDSY